MYLDFVFFECKTCVNSPFFINTIPRADASMYTNNSIQAIILFLLCINCCFFISAFLFYIYFIPKNILIIIFLVLFHKYLAFPHHNKFLQHFYAELQVITCTSHPSLCNPFAISNHSNSSPQICGKNAEVQYKFSFKSMPPSIFRFPIPALFFPKARLLELMYEFLLTV